MPLKRLEDIQDGDIYEFLQIYLNNKPKIFCTRFGDKNPIDESCSFLRQILNELKIPCETILENNLIPETKGENYSYEGIGRASKDNGIIRIWKIPGYLYNKEHLIEYQKKFSNLIFDKDI